MASNNANSPRHFDTEALLELVQKFPFLYDKKYAGYKDPVLKDNQWTLIGAEFGPSHKRDTDDFTVCVYDQVFQELKIFSSRSEK